MKKIILVNNSEYRTQETEESYQRDGNMYGKVLSWDKPSKKYIPIICGCGGSMWLCKKCADKIINELKINE